MRLRTAVVVAALAVTTPLPAHADGVTYYGGCRFESFNDTTPGGMLGSQDVYHAVVTVGAVAKDYGPISALCGIKVDGADRGIVLTAAQRPAATTAAGRYDFTVAVTDVVTLYTTVTTNAGTETNEVPLSWGDPICPATVCGDGGLLESLDPPVCELLETAAPTVDALPTSDVLYVDPASGDTYTGGTAPDDLFWDCPPYVSSRRP